MGGLAPRLLFSCGSYELHSRSHGMLGLAHEAFQLPHQSMLLGVILGFACINRIISRRPPTTVKAHETQQQRLQCFLTNMLFGCRKLQGVGQGRPVRLQQILSADDDAHWGAQGRC